MDERTVRRWIAEYMNDFSANESVEASKTRARFEKWLWSYPYLKRRVENSLRRGIFNVLSLEHPERVRRCMRMNEEEFTELLSKVQPLLQKTGINSRTTLLESDRLILTLRYLTIGETQKSLSTAFEVSQSTISCIIRECCTAIFNALEAEFLRPPCCEEEWSNVAKGFAQYGSFPHCLGAVGGKHIKIAFPNREEFTFSNSRDYHSIVLLAVVDTDLRFIYTDVGTHRQISDWGLWPNCDLYNAIQDHSACVPPPEPFIDGGFPMPYVFIGDQGLPLSNIMMVPYSKGEDSNDARRAFNFRLTRAGVVKAETAFGLLASRFLVFGSTLFCDPDEAICRVKACLALYNWLRTRKLGRALYTPPPHKSHVSSAEETPFGVLTAGGPLEGVLSCSLAGEQTPQVALAIRELFCEYLSSEAGTIPEQASFLSRYHRTVSVGCPGLK